MATAAPNAPAATVVLPNINANNDAIALLQTVFTDAPRVYQMQFAASQLAAVPVGSAINGLAFRLDRSVITHTAGDFDDWSVTLSQATHALNAYNPALNSNIVNPVLVRSGPLAFPAGTYATSNSSDPAPFGPTISFTTPYAYAGGDLVITLSHTGNKAGDFGLLDAAFVGEGGAAAQIQIAPGIGSPAACTIPQLSFTPVPEPTAACLAVVALSATLLTRRRRDLK